MEQVLVLNGLASLVDTRGTGATCEQRDDGTVGCLDTPLGLSAAQAAQTGGETAAYVASRLDVLSQESRDQATRETMRADDLVAASESAESIGDFGSASVAARAAEAARAKARASLAQSAAAAAAAQAVRLGDAPRARMAGDAVVAAAWKGELAEVESGALRGLGVDPAPRTTTVAPIGLAAGSTAFVPNVETFSISPAGIVTAQNGPERLTLFGVKAGEATLTFTTRGSTEQKVAKVGVGGVTPLQAIQAGKDLWDKISGILDEPVLAIDWQDAAVIRVNADAIQRVLATLRNASDKFGADGANFEARQLYAIVGYIKANPQVMTLREAVTGAIDGALTLPSLSRSGRECRWEGSTNYRPLYAFARDYGTAVDVLAITAVTLTAVAGAVATVFTAGAAAPAAAAATLATMGITLSTATVTAIASIAAIVSAAAGYLTSQMPTFAADPDRLVKSFGAAVCAAVNDNAKPRRARAADKLRVQAVAAERQYKIALGFAASAGSNTTGRANALAQAAAARARGQEALAQLLPLDDARFFTSAQNVALTKAKETLNKDDALVRTEVQERLSTVAERRTTDGGGASKGGGASTGGGGGAIVAAGGAAAAAFLLWRFLR
jgi:hypothetical protein